MVGAVTGDDWRGPQDRIEGNLPIVGGSNPDNGALKPGNWTPIETEWSGDQVGAHALHTDRDHQFSGSVRVPAVGPPATIRRWSSIAEPCPPPNSTDLRDLKISVFFSIVFMTVGITSNSLAIVILLKAYQRFRKKSKASFLLFASGLVFTDLFGHLINGTIAVFIYASNRDWSKFDHADVLCSIFGMCMVFFGLCPLLLGSVMAVERCIGVTEPIFHSTKMTSRHAKMILAFVWLFAIFVALLPIMTLRSYHIQATRTWCFLKTEKIEDWMDQFHLLFFSSLGLLSLAISFVCNAMTGITLLRSKLKSQQHRQGRSHHLEMIIQLLAIMCVSCICWTPFLVSSRTHKKTLRTLS
ncbi:unnamed protein product [Ranitomeya imitator]|uniref:Prostaglandin F2-alpha receptor n=1 Tax=Ranitomeya imitator TaxID=111125 RepID=A0ABN9LCZ0_9NEOB|nr:unnamed protein product [Ranitomeya imitator]